MTIARLWIAALFLVSSVPLIGEEPRTWEYMYFKESVPLIFDTFRVAILDPTPSPFTSGSGALKLRSSQGRVPSKTVSGDMGNGWILADLNGTGSGGDPLAVEALIEEFANDPAGDEFASPVFVMGDLTLIVTPRIHVGFNDGVSLATVEQILLDAGIGPIVKSDWIRPNIFVVDAATRSGIEVLDIANALALLPDVYFATVNWMMTGERMAEAVVEYPPEAVLATRNGPGAPPIPRKGAPAPLCGPISSPPNDPLLTESWGLESFNDIDIDAFGAWAICTGSDQVVVAVIGDGVQRDHPDMPNVLAGADFTNECLSPPCLGEPQSSCDAHETPVASIINAAANNGLASVGVAPDVQILPIRAGRYWIWQHPDGDRCVDQTYEGWIGDAIEFAVEQGVSITNLSWNFADLFSADITIAYATAYEAGIVNINSAGNRNAINVFQPGRLFEVHSVSGIDLSGALFYVDASFASNSGPDVEYAGPGRFVFALDRTGSAGYETSSGPYGADALSVTGTSFAAPHVAGVAALIRSMNPALGPPEVAFILRESVLDLLPPGRDNSFGYGLCKAEAALIMAPEVIAIRDFERGDFWGLVVVSE